MDNVTDINERKKKAKEHEPKKKKERHWSMAIPGIGLIAFDPKATDGELAAFLQGIDVYVFGAEARHPQEYIDMLY